MAMSRRRKLASLDPLQMLVAPPSNGLHMNSGAISQATLSKPATAVAEVWLLAPTTPAAVANRLRSATGCTPTSTNPAFDGSVVRLAAVIGWASVSGSDL